MLEIAIMIEGQNGVNWQNWKRMVRAVEDLGFAGLYRSDHYTNASGPDKESLELWTSLTWLADNTKRIDFGPLVSPFSFRDPTMTARVAIAVDDLSGGRLTLGVGAGWQEREHHKFGHDLGSMQTRFERCAEGLEVITRLLNSDEEVSFSGEHYTLRDAVMLPRPQRKGGPPILVGGNGLTRTLPLVAKYATEWNALYQPVAGFKERNERLDELLEENGRGKASVKRSMMTGCIFGRNAAEIQAQLRPERTIADYRNVGAVVGTTSELVDQLGELHEAGVQRIMLQWLALDDIDRLEAMATELLPQFT